MKSILLCLLICGEPRIKNSIENYLPFCFWQPQFLHQWHQQLCWGLLFWVKQRVPFKWAWLEWEFLKSFVSSPNCKYFQFSFHSGTWSYSFHLLFDPFILRLKREVHHYLGQPSLYKCLQSSLHLDLFYFSQFCSYDHPFQLWRCFPY